MYPVSDSLPVDDLDPGAYLLAGPAMSGKYDLLISFIGQGLASGEGALFVSTNADAAGVIADIEDGIRDVTDQLRLVDCVSERGGGSRLPAQRVEYVSSPGDLTGIGIGVSEQLRRFNEADVTHTRVAFHTLSTLLMYAELETVFRFLHVLTGRISTIDGVGLFAIDPSVHDEGVVNTLKQLFDGMIELRDAEEGGEIRVLGVNAESREWVTRP